MNIPTGRYWWPAQPVDRRCAKDLTPGLLVIVDRTPYRMIEVCEREPVDWDQAESDRWNQAGRPDPATWPRRPLTLLARREADAPGSLGTAEYFAIDEACELMQVLPEHYSVCRCCGELPPCRHNELEAAIARETTRMARILEILPGCCHACLQPVTTRQRSISFPGMNLLRPDLGYDSALFHLRQGCLGAAISYDAQWAAAVPGRRLRLSCPGHLTVHHQAPPDCSEGALCPGRDVRHTNQEWHHPTAGAPFAAACWCVTGAQAAAPAPATPGSETGGTGAKGASHG